jgi:hypothetical protein
VVIAAERRGDRVAQRIEKFVKATKKRHAPPSV